MNIPFIELLCDKKNYKNLNLKEQVSNYLQIQI